MCVCVNKSLLLAKSYLSHWVPEGWFITSKNLFLVKNLHCYQMKSVFSHCCNLFQIIIKYFVSILVKNVHYY